MKVFLLKNQEEKFDRDMILDEFGDKIREVGGEFLYADQWYKKIKGRFLAASGTKKHLRKRKTGLLMKYFLENEEKMMTLRMKVNAQ